MWSYSARTALLVSAVLLLLPGIPPAASPSPRPSLTVHIQAIRVSDDDGKRSAAITAAQFSQWVEFANKCYADAGIKFLFDPMNDFTSIKSTMLNGMVGIQDPNWSEEEDLGDSIAARYPDKITVFCRYGPGERPTGGGFSWDDYNFIALGGYEGMTHCGHPHLDALAHEIGHYLGLTHTFAGQPFADVAHAEEFLRSKDNDIAAFDGDGLDDTPPDPCIRFTECEHVSSVRLNGIEVPLPRRNLMSYYDERDTLSPQQIARSRWFLQARMKNGMGMPTNRNAVSPIEAESLKVSDRRGCGEFVQSMAPWGAKDWSGGNQLFLVFQPGSSITLQLPVKTSGKHRVSFYITHAPDFGIVRVYLDDRPLGKPIDGYAPVVATSGRIALGTADLTEGMHHLRLDSVGKNKASTSHYFGLDCIELVR